MQRGSTACARREPFGRNHEISYFFAGMTVPDSAGNRYYRTRKYGGPQAEAVILRLATPRPTGCHVGIGLAETAKWVPDRVQL